MLLLFYQFTQEERYQIAVLLQECLGFKTPNQLCSGINPPVALAS
jgi:hypothetical protein